MFSVKCVVYLFALMYSTNCEDKVLPSYIQPCDLSKADYANCIKEQISLALPHFTKGVPELGVPSIDPVQLDDIHIDGNGLKLGFYKAQMHGLSKGKLSQLKVKIGKEDEAFTLAFKCDLKLIAQYDIDGKILILPIKGNGDATVLATGVEVILDGILTHKNTTEGEFFKLITPTYKYDIKKTTFDLKNLFNGNKQLAETTIQFANENWQQLMDELAPPAILQIVKTIVKSINKFFLSLPIFKLFTNYDTIVASRSNS